MFESWPVRSIHNILQTNNPSRHEKKHKTSSSSPTSMLVSYLWPNLNFQSPTKKDAKKVPISPSSPNRPHKHPNKWSTACGAAATSKHQDLRNFFPSVVLRTPPEKLNMELGHHVPPSVDGYFRGTFFVHLHYFQCSPCDFGGPIVCPEMANQVSGQEGYLGKT